MIVALDVATLTGVAVGNPGSVPKAWSVSLGKPGNDDSKFSGALVLTHTLIEAHRPRLLAIEAPVGGPKASHLLIGLAACIRGVAENRGVEVHAYPINSIRKHFMGRALAKRDYPALSVYAAKKAMKGEVMQRCRLLGWQVSDDNAADAAALWDFACALSGYDTTPAGGLFR